MNASTHLEFTVTDSDTATAVGSGSVEVLGTPRLLAWCEAVTCEAVANELEDGATTVGTRVALDHLKPSPVGQQIRVEASIAHRDGRLYRFTVAAHHLDESGQMREMIGSGEITRLRVETERFMERVTG